MRQMRVEQMLFAPRSSESFAKTKRIRGGAEYRSAPAWGRRSYQKIFTSD